MRKKIVEQMLPILPLPIAGGHVVLFESIAEYTV